MLILTEQPVIEDEKLLALDYILPFGIFQHKMLHHYDERANLNNSTTKDKI